jgi:mannose-6-phosphate isomerase-like protein (cupin superfamily)
METVNAIAKVRFSSAKPQCIQLHKGGPFHTELICMEPGQELKLQGGDRAYYVITGTAVLKSGGKSAEVPTGQLATAGPNEPHAIATSGERRLVCLAIGRTA